MNYFWFAYGFIILVCLSMAVWHNIQGTKSIK